MQFDGNTFFDGLLPAELSAWVGVNMPPPPAAVPLPALRRPVAGADDPNELIRYRFLCRGGTALLVGPTGAGKSSLAMQMALCFASGRPCLGLEPARPLSVVIIQAENDEGDLAEMRDGVLAGLQWTAEDALAAQGRVHVATVDDKTGPAFAAVLGALCAEFTPDMVFMDPAFAYLGGDALAQKEVSPFLRNQILPVVHQFNIGLFIVHHANKPPAGGQQKAHYLPGDFAYLGAGSAEWANVCRAVLALRATEDARVFELRAAKRGFRLRWHEGNLPEGDPTTMRYVAYNREQGVICWHEADADQVPREKRDRGQDIVDAIHEGATTHTALCKKLGLKKATASDWLAKLKLRKVIVETSEGDLRLTGKIPARAAVSGEEKT